MSRYPKKPISNYGKFLEYNGWREWMNSSFCKPIYKDPEGRDTNRPAPFYRCEICERLESHIEMAHMGRFYICTRHPREKLNWAADDNWRETIQISVANSIITEIRKCAT